MKKHVFYSELAYLCGLFLIALGVVLTEKADFGVSMIVAPAYLLYRWLNPIFSFFTFGMAEYCFQAALLVLMGILLRGFRLSYLLSFATAVIYGFILDGLMLLGAFLPFTIALRFVYYGAGLFLSSAGVSMMFHTYLSPEAYELFVKEVSAHFGIEIHRFKTRYDAISCIVGVIMSFCIYGMWHFVGVNWGTVFCTLINGRLIGAISSYYERHWQFSDRLTWRPFFTGQPPVKTGVCQR